MPPTIYLNPCNLCIHILPLALSYSFPFILRRHTKGVDKQRSNDKKNVKVNSRRIPTKEWS